MRRPLSKSNSTSCTARECRAKASLIDLGVKEGIVDKSGAWYSYSGDRIGQGRDNVREFLKQNMATLQSLSIRQLRAKLLGGAKAEDSARRAGRGGRGLSSGRAADLAPEVAPELDRRLRERALSLLARREHARAELRRKLQRACRGWAAAAKPASDAFDDACGWSAAPADDSAVDYLSADDVVERVLDELERQQLLSEARFARAMSEPARIGARDR